MKENWLRIKSPDDYGVGVITFEGDKISYYSVEENDNSLQTKYFDGRFDILKMQSINKNRIRIFSKGITINVIDENSYSEEETIFETDYEKLVDTKTVLSKSEIEKLSFEFKVNDKQKILGFNQSLDSLAIQKINESLKRKGSVMKLRNLNNTLFLAFFFNEFLDQLIPIREINSETLTLYGFHTEPYEIVCNVVKQHS